jgi:hypothetical protein
VWEEFWDAHLLLEIFADLVVHFQFFIDFLHFVLVEVAVFNCVIGGGNGRSEKVEE